MPDSTHSLSWILVATFGEFHIPNKISDDLRNLLGLNAGINQSALHTEVNGYQIALRIKISADQGRSQGNDEPVEGNYIAASLSMPKYCSDTHASWS